MAWQKDYGKSAKLAAAEAMLQAQRAEQSADEAQAVTNANKTKWLPAVATVELRNSTYPNPAHGDTVKVTGESRIYRFDSVSGWVVTDEYNATAIDKVTTQLAETAELNKFDRNAEIPLNIPTYDESNQTTHPSVLFFENGWNGYKYWMGHTPYPFSNDDFENPSVICSNNGIDWVTPSTNPVDKPSSTQTANGGYMSDIDLVMVNGVMECWYRYTDTTTEQLMRKKSTDGSTWSTREIVYDYSGIGVTLSPAVLFENNKYRMWHVAESLNVYYTESPTGILGTWTDRVIVPLSYNGEVYRPWHLDVFKDVDGLYKLILNAFEPLSDVKRHLLIGESTDGSYFENVTLLLSPNVSNVNRFDTTFIYRASAVYTGVEYKLYYGAYNGYTGKWAIGMLQGDKLENVKKVEYINQKNEQILQPIATPRVATSEGGYINNESIVFHTTGVKSVQIKNTAPSEITIQSQEGLLAQLKIKGVELEQGSFLNHEILLFRTEGVKAARLQNTATNQLSVKTEAGDLDGNFRVNDLIAQRIVSALGANIEFILPKITSVRSTDGTDPLFLIVKGGVVGVALSTGSQVATAKVATEDGSAHGALEVKSVIFKDNGADYTVEGAVRYNTVTKKHEGYNGTVWNAFY